MKQPERDDVYKLLRTKSAEWEEFARELKIDDNYRKQLRPLIITSTDDDILDKVLARWIQSESSEVTWRCILNVLKELKYIDLLKIAQMYLRKEDVIKRYCKKHDFEFTGERLMKIVCIMVLYRYNNCVGA